jgi:replicative DNA helicase
MRNAYDDTAEVFELLDTTYGSLAELLGEVESGSAPVTMAEIMGRIVDNRERPVRIPLGMGQMDDCVAMGPGDIMIVGARPAVGKTAAGLTFTRNVAKQGYRVLSITLEMSDEQLTARVTSTISGVDSNRITLNTVSEEERERMAAKFTENGDWLNNILVDDRATLRDKEVFGLFARARNRYKVDLILIDYIQLSDAEGNTGHEVMSKFSKTVKQAAKKEGLRVIELSQLKRRDGNEEKPIISDLRESGQLEADGDYIVLLGRAKGSSQMSADLVKNKFGPIGYFIWNYDLSTQHISGIGSAPPVFNPALPASIGHAVLPPERDDDSVPF